MKYRLILGLLVLAVALVLAACMREETADTEDMTSTTPSTTATTEPMLTPDEVKLAVEDPIAVSIKNDRIDVTGTPLPGATRFQVTNDSDQVRTLVIEGPAVRASLEAPLQPLEIRTITVDVQPATYRLVSPAPANGSELSAEVTVTAPEGSAATSS